MSLLLLLSHAAGSGNVVSVPAGALTLTGFAPTVVVTNNQTIAVPAGALSLTGFDPVVIYDGPVVVTVPLGALVLTGYAPTVVATGQQTASATGGWWGYQGPRRPTEEETQAQREAIGIVPKRPKLTKPAPKKPEIPVTTEVPPDLRGKDLAIWIELLNQDIKHGADIVPPQQLDLMQRARAVALQRQEEEDIAFVLGTVIAAIED